MFVTGNPSATGAAAAAAADANATVAVVTKQDIKIAKKAAKAAQKNGRVQQKVWEGKLRLLSDGLTVVCNQDCTLSNV